MYFENIRPEELFRQHVNGRGILVDVRSPVEFQSGHIPGAINIPYAELQYRMQELREQVVEHSKQRGGTVVLVYCERGNTSLRASRDLTKAGFRVKNMYGGIKNYHGPLTSD